MPDQSAQGGDDQDSPLQQVSTPSPVSIHYSIPNFAHILICQQPSTSELVLLPHIVGIAYGQARICDGGDAPGSGSISYLKRAYITV